MCEAFAGCRFHSPLKDQYTLSTGAPAESRGGAGYRRGQGCPWLSEAPAAPRRGLQRSRRLLLRI
ncbi:hypothetical protein EYF80_055931 [Liparis tanakae]|uniref:Uncharacterized protein n=1 Tax=Liparis tanakae TaxID=230148 RepID=A0A4Z2EY73_9TELE|nr:hypothetical protein EYF80_055931 [Liparis tanakae]